MTFLLAGGAPAWRRRLALGALVGATVSAATDASAIDIQVGSVASNRFGSSWTLDGGSMTRTRAKMLAATEVSDGFTVSITDTEATVNQSVLSQFDIFFIGFLSDSDPDAFTATELDDMVQWVNNGGQMLLTCDSVSFDAVCNHFGYTLDSLSSANPAVVVPGQESHPIFDGPYGVVSQFQMWGSQGGFSGFPASAELLAQSSNVPPLQVVMFQELGAGSVIALSDVDVMSNNTLSTTTTFAGTGTNDNDHLLGNILARVDTLIDGDDDGVRDLFDNCPSVANPLQTDADGDTFGAACDCDDGDITINPLALEACDGVDNDCDPGSQDGSDELWFGNACDSPDDSDLCAEGLDECILGARSCSDSTGDALELCDTDDNDCNPATPDGADEPGFGTACDGTDSDLCEEGTFQCNAGTYACSDATGDIPDLCDGTDEDCNPATPDGADEAWYGTACDGADSDLCNEGTLVCDGVTQVCSDTSDDTLDVCDGVDNDCDPASDDGSEDPSLGATCDGDDSDLCTGGVFECVSGALSCDDPGEELDVCDGADNDCNPATPDGADEIWYGSSCDLGDTGECTEGAYDCVSAARACSVVQVTVYPDTDADGCGDPDAPMLVCPSVVPAGTVDNADDQDDTNGACCGNGVVEVGEDCDWGYPPLPPASDAGSDAGSDGGKDAAADASGAPALDASALADAADAARDGSTGDAASSDSGAAPNPIFDPTCPLSCTFPVVPEAGAGGTAAGGMGAMGGVAEAGPGGVGGLPGGFGGVGGIAPAPSGGAGGSGGSGLGGGGTPSADAGFDEPLSSKDEGGCGCRVPAPTSPGRSGAAGLVLLALAALRRRQNRGNDR